MPTEQHDLFDEVLESARRHGEDSEPDHEVGDLQDALRIAWKALTLAQRRQAHREFFVDHERWYQ